MPGRSVGTAVGGIAEFDPVTGDLYVQDNGFNTASEPIEPLSTDASTRVVLKARGGDDEAALKAQFTLAGYEHVSAIVSTLPILNFAKADQKAVLDGCFAHAAPTTAMTQITYLPGSPVRQRALAGWGYQAKRVSRIGRNWPPATLWQYRRVEP